MINSILLATLITFVIYEVVIILAIRNLVDGNNNKLLTFIFSNIMVALILGGVSSCCNSLSYNISLFDYLKYSLGIPLGMTLFVLMKIALFKLFIEEGEPK